LKTKDCHELPIKMRRALRQANPRMQLAGRDLSLEEDLNQFIMFHGKSHQTKARLMRPSIKAFILAMASSLNEAG